MLNSILTVISNMSPDFVVKERVSNLIKTHNTFCIEIVHAWHHFLTKFKTDHIRLHNGLIIWQRHVLRIVLIITNPLFCTSRNVYKVTQGFIRKFYDFPCGILENYDFGACPLHVQFFICIYHLHWPVQKESV